MTYQHFWLARHGDPDVLEFKESPLPAPGPDQVCLRIEAAGVIYADLLTRRGTLKHPNSPDLPYVPGNEAVGVIEAVGAGVTALAVGDRVAALMHAGGYATHVCTDAWRCIPVPDGVAPEKAVCLLVNYWTAYHLLHRIVKLNEGQRILIHGAAGGLGTAISQLGRLLSLDMYGTASASKHDLLTQTGVTPIDYRSEDFVKRLCDLTPDGVDVVFDTVGGAYWRRSYRTLRKGGTLIICGVRIPPGRRMRSLLPQALLFAPRAFLPDGKRVKAVFLVQDKLKDEFRQDVATLMELLANGEIEPVIGKVMPLREAAQAHHLLEEAQVRGKIVLTTALEA